MSLSEDKYLNPDYGFQWIDTVVDPNAKAFTKRFCEMNSPNSMRVPGSHFLGMSLLDRSAMFGNNQNGFGFGGGFGGGMFGGGGFPGMGGFGGGFSNGGFSFANNGFAQQNQMPQNQIIAGVKYNMSVEETNGYRMTTVRITEIVELAHVFVENFMKYVAGYFADKQYRVLLDLDISKVTPAMLNCIRTYFYPVNNGSGSSLSNFVSYENILMPKESMCRLHPEWLSIPAFKTLHKDLASDPSFPKDLSTMDNRVKFEEFRSKAGYVQVLNPGNLSLTFNPNAYQSVIQDYYQHLEAIWNNCTLEEYMERRQNDQMNPNTQQGYQNAQQQGFSGFGQQFGQFAQFGAPQGGFGQFGGGFGQGGFGGQYGRGFGGGNFGGGFGRFGGGAFGRFGGQRQGGFGQFGGGFGQQGAFGGGPMYQGQQPVYGGMGYGMQGAPGMGYGQPQGVDMYGNPIYAQQGPGYGPMQGGGPVPQTPGMGGPQAAYQPSQFAGGQMPGNAGKYIP